MAKDTSTDSDSRSGGALLGGSRWIRGAKSTGGRPARSSRRSAWRAEPMPGRKTLDRVRANVAPLSDVAIDRLGEDLPLFAELQPKYRSELGLMAQRGIVPLDEVWGGWNRARGVGECLRLSVLGSSVSGVSLWGGVFALRGWL